MEITAISFFGSRHKVSLTWDSNPKTLKYTLLMSQAWYKDDICTVSSKYVQLSCELIFFHVIC